MDIPVQHSSSPSDTLKARKTHLVTLLKVIDSKQAKITTTQTLTINAIKAEMGLIEHRLKNRN